MEVGLIYKPGKTMELEGYSDADFAGDVNDRKSTSGYVFMDQGAVISWRSKKQTVVAQSTAEAEYVALAAVTQEAQALRKLYQTLGLPPVKPTKIWEDNQAAIAIAENPINYKRTKHIDVKYHYTRDQLEKGTIEIAYCATDDQLADIFTKSLPRVQFQTLRCKLGLSVPRSGGVLKVGTRH
jgi:hypothetical protein